MDDADRAQAVADQEAERIIAAARSRNAIAAAAGEPRPPLRACIDCDDPIEAARLSVQPRALRCTACQADAEAGARTRLGVAA